MHRACLLRAIFPIAMAACLLIGPARAFGSTHYIAANGSDSNDGMSTATPWLHAPGMPNCGGTCASYTPAAGDSIIFRGGDTWHFGNSSLSPYVGGTWGFNHSGSSGSPIYIGVDQTWFSGSSWARPIFNFDNPLTPNPKTIGDTVSNCTYQSGGANNGLVVNGNFVTVDNFEWTGFCWNTNQSNNAGGNMMLKFNGSTDPNGEVIENNYVHGWSHTSAGTQGNGGVAFYSWNQHSGTTLQYNVVDGVDSDPASMTYFMGFFTDLQYNVIRYNQGAVSSSGCHRVHDNLFEHMDNVTDGSAHSDVLQCYGEQANGSSDPNLFYNNVFRYIPDSGVSLSNDALWIFPPSGQTDYVFNNVAHDILGTSPYFGVNQGGGPGGGNATFLNNTATHGNSSSVIWNNLGSSQTVTSINNLWITSGGESSIFATTSGVVETSALYMASSTAAAQGYTSSNDYRPTSATNSTVGAGTNESSICNSFVDALAVNSCLNGTTLGCQYVLSNHTVSCPNVPAIARPSTGAWDIGASQYSATVSGNQPAPPSNLVVTIH